MEKTHYPNFDLMRLLLALEVVYDHARFLANQVSEWNAPIMAVPCFLAISGFLVLKSYENSGSWGIFMRKRALRLLPALVASIVMCLMLLGNDVTRKSILTWITGGIYFVPGVSYNFALWSLGWEEIAYGVLALLWLIGAYRRPLAIWALLVASLIPLPMVSHLDGPIQMRFILWPAFFVGNLMYMHRAELMKINPLVPWALLLTVIFREHMPFAAQIIDANAVLYQSFAVVWVGMTGMKAIPFKFPDVSYGLYIYHLPLILFLIKIGSVSDARTMAFWLPLPLVAVCIASWYLVEKPALKFKAGPRLSASRGVECG